MKGPHNCDMPGGSLEVKNPQVIFSEILKFKIVSKEAPGPETYHTWPVTVCGVNCIALGTVKLEMFRFEGKRLITYMQNFARIYPNEGYTSSPNFALSKDMPMAVLACKN